MEELTWKERKEQFVSGLNGTTVLEVTVIVSIFPIFWLVRAIFLNWITGISFLRQNKFFRFLLDFLLMIFPFVLTVTELADVATQVLLSVVVLSISALVVLKSIGGATSDEKEENASFVLFSDNAVSDILCDDDSFATEKNSNNNMNRCKSSPSTHVVSRKLPFLNAFRASVNVATCVCILAVDFHVFPRRLAKTEDFGSGLMDVGVGMYILSNAMISREARFLQKREIDCLHFRALLFQLISSWPLVLLGLFRLLSVKFLGYNEHISEYGVHWNFFLSLACVKNIAAVISFFTKAKYCLFISIAIALVYQFVLVYPLFDATGILLNSERDGILMQNKEGLASCLGLLSLYFAGVSLGAYIFKPRHTLRQWFQVSVKLFLFSLALYYSLHYCSINIQAISRRMANLAYILWMLAVSVFILSMFIFFHVVTSWYISNNWLSIFSMPDKWIIVSHEKTADNLDYSPPPPPLCIYCAIARNSLFYFLICNLATGVINGLVDTMSVGKYLSIAVLVAYKFVITLLIWILHVKEITLKFW